MKKTKLWQTDSGLHPLVEEFTVGNDYVLDMQLLPYDIRASIAHARMLFEIKAINVTELEDLLKGLNEILGKWHEGKFTIEREQEDGHTAIEQYLTEHYGEVGKKIHTGRSRNDQSLVMTRLFMKDSLSDIQKELAKTIKTFDAKSKECNTVVMPGYTHLQKAMPTTVGVWLDSFSAGLKDFNELLLATIKMIDQNPLGSASGFGISNYPLSRELTTKEMGFAKMQDNPMYCGLSRGYFENIVLQTLSQPMILSGKFANDMMLFTTQEFNYVSLPKNFTTGSSIMPQKRNYDIFEIMRGNVKVYNSHQSQVQAIVSSIGSGYQRDLQLTKEPFIRGVNMCKLTVQLLTEVVDNLNINEDKLKTAMTDDLYVTNEVYELVKQGSSFRDAYIEIKNKINKS